MAERPLPQNALDALSQISGQRRDEILSIWDEVKANHARLQSCPRHYFKPRPVKLGDKATCLVCGGTISLVGLSNYIDGYIAAGGIADDIWLGWADRYLPPKETPPA